jgi:hypothetical protein
MFEVRRVPNVTNDVRGGRPAWDIRGERALKARCSLQNVRSKWCRSGWFSSCTGTRLRTTSTVTDASLMKSTL